MVSRVSGKRLLCTGAASERDAVVLFGNLPGARRHARTEFHPVASGLGEGTQNHVAKRDAGTRCWWLVLAEQVGISVHIYWLGRVSWGTLLVPREGSWFSQSPGDATPCLHLSHTSSWGGEDPDKPTPLLLLCGLCKAEFALSSFMFQEPWALGNSSADVALDLVAKGQGLQHGDHWL